MCPEARFNGTQKSIWKRADWCDFGENEYNEVDYLVMVNDAYWRADKRMEAAG